MITETPKRLPEDLGMSCYACEKQTATHLCRYKIDDLVVQVCLCPECMQMDTQHLLKNTIGIQEMGHAAIAEYRIQKKDADAEAAKAADQVRIWL